MRAKKQPTQTRNSVAKPGLCSEQGIPNRLGPERCFASQWGGDAFSALSCIVHAVVVASVIAICSLAAAAQEGSPRDSANSAEHIVVEGQITNHIGAGHVGAEVVARRKSTDGGEGKIIGTTKTDNFGDFAIKSPTPVTGDIVVSVSLPRHVTLVQEFHLGDDEFPPYLADVLLGDVEVAGRVYRADTNAPIKGASIVITADELDWQAESDDAGRFKVRGVPPGRGRIVVRAPGFGRVQKAIANLQDPGEILVPLSPGRVAKLIVVDDEGKPIPGVFVECLDEDHDDFRTAETDETGSVTLEGLCADTDLLSVKLVHDDHVSNESYDRQLFLPDEPKSSEHKLVMKRAGKIGGSITDAETGQGLNGARVMTGSAESYDSPRDWSGYEGRYTVSGVAPGETVVTVHLSDYGPELATAKVSAGETATLDFKLRPGTHVKGTVKGEDGEPVSGAYVAATKWRDHETLGLRAITGEDGGFVIEDAPHDEFEVRVSFRGMVPVKEKVKADSAKPIEISLLVDPSASARGGGGASKIKVGEPAPNVTLTTLKGEKLELAKLTGKTILLDFWATWCGPCVGDLPHLKSVYKKYGGRKDFVMIGVSLDFDDKTLSDFVKKRELGWHQVVGEAGGSEAAADAYGVAATPHMFIINAQGKVEATNLMGSELDERIEKLLDKKSDAP